MKIAAMFLWIAVPFLVIAAHNSFGSPHMLLTYTFDDNGDRHNLAVPRYYRSCTYYGWSWHEMTVPAQSGRCRLIRLFHLSQ